MFNFNKKTNIEKIPIPLFYQSGGDPPEDAKYTFEYYLSYANIIEQKIATDTFIAAEMLGNDIFPRNKLVDLSYTYLDLEKLWDSLNLLLTTKGISEQIKSKLQNLLLNHVNKQTNISILKQGNDYTIKIILIDRHRPNSITEDEASTLNNLTRQGGGGGYKIKIPIPIHLF